jgi:hypothetical protein
MIAGAHWQASDVGEAGAPATADGIERPFLDLFDRIAAVDQ